MASTFNRAIANSHRPHAPWLVLEPPTGSGKSQGLAVYAAMLLRSNATALPPTGILIVTRTIAQADEMVATIREAAGIDAADPRVVAKHSEARMIRAEHMRGADVLVICHAAYTRALEGLLRGGPTRWTDFVTWTHGLRRLTVIDEALADVVEEHQVRPRSLRYALGLIDAPLRRRFPEEVAALERLLVTLDKIEGEAAAARERGEYDTATASIRWQAGGRAKASPCPPLDELRATMRRHAHDVIETPGPLDRRRRVDRIDATLKAAEAVMTRWAYYHQVGAEPTFNASQLLIPPGLPGPVVLDATASQNALWELLEDRAEIVPTQPGARRYDNVTLHVLRTSGTGKEAMGEAAATRAPQLLAHLRDNLGKDRRVLAVVHKDVEHRYVWADHPWASYATAHWGNLDGRNDWQDADAVVLFGLPWRPDTWANNMFFALQGLPTSPDWFQNPEWREYPNVRAEITRRQLAVDIIQAINRARCRRVVDDDGGCLPTDVYVTLPFGPTGERLLDAIRAEMPGIVVKDWAFTLDGPRAKLRKASSHLSVLTFMENREPGETSFTRVCSECGIQLAGRKELQKALRNAQHPLTAALLEIGVVYDGGGRGKKACLVKGDTH